MRARMSCCLIVILWASAAAAQVATGVPPFNSFGGGPFDTVDLADLNVHFQIPIISKSGRGMPFWYVLSYDSSMWMPGTSNGVNTWVRSPNGGWAAQSSGLTGSITSPSTTTYCYDSNGHPLGTIVYISLIYLDPQGTSHEWGDVWTIYNSGCSGTNITSFSGSNGDGSGLVLTAVQGPGGYVYITRPDGTIVKPTTLVQDRNGNQITISSDGLTFTDSLNTSGLVISNPASSSDPSYSSETDYTYQAPAGTQLIKVFSNSVFLQANFGCGYSASSAQSTSLIQKILFPDGSHYLFSYEPTSGAPSNYYTGRITSVTLATGGTITYSYTGGTNGVVCADGSTAGLSRTLNPNTTDPQGTWGYARSGSGSAWTTTVTDPGNNTTTASFSGLYETQRVVKDSGNNPLLTVDTCYNGNTSQSTCATAAVNAPITQRNVFTQPGAGVYSQVQYSYNSLGLITDEYDYDYYNGSSYPLLRHAQTAYASLGNNISGLPSQVSIYDSGGLKAQTNYTYDEYTTDANGHGPLQSTSEPQHASISGSRGNLTTISRLVSGSNYLSQYFSYFDTGNLQNSFDANGAETTNTYGACGNAFVTNIAQPLSLSRSIAWDTNCSGGVMVSLTDENGKLTTYSYNDPNFWRVNAVTDPLLNQRSVAYGANPPTTVESTLNFNSGTSTADVLSTVDGLGRPIFSQRRQAPGSQNFDSVQTGYDAVGRQNRVTLAYSAGAGSSNTTAPAVTTTYDGIGRVQQVSDAGGGYTSYSYSQNTTTMTVGPAPNGEVTKQRELIYDGLGRLIQVNEPSSPMTAASAGSGSVTISGSEQSSTQTATSGTTTIIVSGGAQSTSVGCPNHCTDIYNSGNVYVTINGTQYSGGYGGSTITAGTVASGLAGSMNSGGIVTASVSGSTITVTAVATGSATNYSVSTSCSYSPYFTSCGFSASGGNMTGGRDASTAYDNGTVSVTVNGTTSSASYGQGSTNTSVATALATAINGNSPVVTASASGNIVNITANTTGSGTNYSLSASSSSSVGFNPASFSTSSSGSSLTGGQNASGGLLSPYKTIYSYNALNKLIGATQNAQDVSSNWQTRSYSYDGLGRMTQETTPEAGTVNYTYDTDSTCGTYKGDLVKKVDAVGNVTCFAYDALHRLTATTYPLGSYASSTPEKHYVYDSAIVNGVSMPNAKGRLAEAYTGPSGSKITDEGFGYSARGETTDVYELTPHSAGYYHVNVSYWANGTMSQLSGIPTVPNITYAPDAEGRINTVSAASGQNPVTATTYSVAGLPTAVTFGSADSDAFTYDSNTNRMTKYTFNVNGQAVVGTLSWNANGTPSQLAITDPFDSANQQTCTYVSDQLTRISSVSCGNTWSQTFSYDVFGNVSKSGTAAWAATYSMMTNRILNVGGFNPSYDASGNLTNDSGHTYAWDSDGHAVTVDSVNLTYDAEGRVVEQNRSGSYTQVLYGATGTKLALMNGQALQKAFVSLPGKATAVYLSTGLSYYRHADKLGSSRVASTTSRTVYYDGAYAPFGESYSEMGTTDRSFTGQNQDTVNGLYDFPAREYSAPQGRWVSPDPGSLAVADLSNPQSLNRYAYVANSPLAYVDPDGTTTGEGVCGFSSCSPSYGGPGVGFSGPMEAVSASGGFTPTSHSEVPWFNSDWSPWDYKVTGVNITVLGQTDPVTYQGTKENALQVAAGSLQAGADRLNKADKAGDLSDYDRTAILDVKSIDIIDQGPIGVVNPALGKINLPFEYVQNTSFAAFIATTIAHEGVHIINFQNGWYQGSYLDESTALQETIHIGVMVGMSSTSINQYMNLLQDKAWQQAHIMGCNYVPGHGC